MITSRMLQKDHLCWQQAVQHERRDALKFSHNKSDVYDYKKLDKKIDELQSLKAKKNFYGKHLAKYM